MRSQGGWKVAALGLATVLAIGVMWYMSLPSVARVETFKRAGNVRAILSIVRKCGVETKRADVVQAGAHAVLAIGRAQDLEQLAAFSTSPAIATSNRLLIVRTFENRGRLPPGVRDLIARETTADVRKAWIDACVRVEPTFFRRRVIAKVAEGLALLPDEPVKALAAIEGAANLDVRQKHPSVRVLARGAAMAAILRQQVSGGRYETASETFPELKSLAPAQFHPDLQAMAELLDDLIGGTTSLELTERDIREEKTRELAATIKAAELEGQLQGVFPFDGIIVNTIDGMPNLYEVSFNLYDPMQRAVLKTVRTSFSTKGRFSMYVRRLENADIIYRSGFSASTPVVEEVPDAAAKQSLLLALQAEARESRENQTSFEEAKKRATADLARWKDSMRIKVESIERRLLETTKRQLSLTRSADAG